MEPSAVQKIAVMRGLGFSVQAIADELSIGTATASRAISRYAKHIKKGQDAAQITDTVRQQVIASVTDNAALELAKQLKENLALAGRMNQKIHSTMENLETNEHQASAETARALASLSTTMKNLDTMIRDSLTKSAGESNTGEESLPELRISVISDEDARAYTMHKNDPDREGEELPIGKFVQQRIIERGEDPNKNSRKYSQLTKEQASEYLKRKESDETLTLSKFLSDIESEDAA